MIIGKVCLFIVKPNIKIFRWDRKHPPFLLFVSPVFFSYMSLGPSPTVVKLELIIVTSTSL